MGGRDNQHAQGAETIQLQSWSTGLWKQCLRWLLPYIVKKEAKILKVPAQQSSSECLLFWLKNILTSIYIWIGSKVMIYGPF